MDPEDFIAGLFGTVLLALACFAIGACSMGVHWRYEIVEQGRAHYIVDERTGKVELVWTNGGGK